MDWDFNKANESSGQAAFNKGVFEGGQMEIDAVKWITDKICTLIYDEMKNTKSERGRAAITAAMPMMAVAAVVTFTNIAAKPDPKYRLRAQSLMLKAAMDFTSSQLSKIDREIKDLPTEKSDQAEHEMFEAVKQAMDDMGKMPRSEWIKKHGDLVNKLEQMKVLNLKKRKDKE